MMSQTTLAATMAQWRRAWPALAHGGSTHGRPDEDRPHRFAHLLLFAILAFVVLFLLWASWASLDEVTRGDGKVIPSSQVQIVQNLEGGIVSEILVREGAIVPAGSILLRIDNAGAASNLKERRQREVALVAALARLRAEVAGAEIQLPADIAAEAADIAANELDLFRARRDALRSELAILQDQAEQRGQEITELTNRQEQLQRSLGLAREELAITEPLAAKRVVPKVELLRLRRQVNDLQGELASTELALPRAELARREAERRIEERRLGFRAEAQRELGTLQAELAVLKEGMTADADRVRRTDVRSPVRGTVKRLHVATLGGVIKPGQDLVEIVPLEDTLLVEARVRPADIAFLRPGLPALVKVTAYDFALYGGLEARVEDISADTIADERGESFFRVRVRTSSNELERAGEVLPIIPGMTTQVDILTGEKTVLDYLLKPILTLRDQAMRER
jgi:adhesin transport system membrane fusion protein